MKELSRICFISPHNFLAVQNLRLNRHKIGVIHTNPEPTQFQPPQSHQVHHSNNNEPSGRQTNPRDNRPM